MAHTDRQPSQEIFDDIKQAAKQTWNLLMFHHDLHADYYNEKVGKIDSLENYADNWYTCIGMLDDLNQHIFVSLLNRKDTKEFLRKQAIHYMYVLPRVETDTEVTTAAKNSPDTTTKADKNANNPS